MHGKSRDIILMGSEEQLDVVLRVHDHADSGTMVRDIAIGIFDIIAAIFGPVAKGILKVERDFGGLFGLAERFEIAGLADGAEPRFHGHELIALVQFLLSKEIIRFEFAHAFLLLLDLT